MITMKTKYALKALAYLAQTPAEEPVLIAEIAEREGIPRKFLELILAELKQHGFVHSRKGRGGGYYLHVSREDLDRLGDASLGRADRSRSVFEPDRVPEMRRLSRGGDLWGPSRHAGSLRSVRQSAGEYDGAGPRETGADGDEGRAAGTPLLHLSGTTSKHGRSV